MSGLHLSHVTENTMGLDQPRNRARDPKDTAVGQLVQRPGLGKVREVGIDW